MDYYTIFFVNKAYAFSLDINAAAENVLRLQHAIYNEIQLKVHDQVILTSTGLTLEGHRNVSDYKGVGTAANPAYLFDRRFSRNEREDPTSSQEVKQLSHRIDEAIDQAQRVERESDPAKQYLDLPDRARDCKSAATAGVAMCARMIQEHTLMANGWNALVSNMDGSVQKMRSRAVRFQKNRDRIFGLRDKAGPLLEDFQNCLDQLKGITLPVTLLSNIGKHYEMTLHDWIQSTDANASLEELVDQVKSQFKKAEEWSSERVTHDLDRVYEQSRSADYREIKGINMRLNQLESVLVKAEDFEKIITDLVVTIVQTPQKVGPQSLVTMMDDHREAMHKIYEHLREYKKMMTMIHQSKMEILTNLKQRLSGWIVQGYEKLHLAHNEIVVFEEKYLGLKQRIDLVTQIKEAPIVYSTAVTEIIRRSTLQKEFTSWQKTHKENCGKFSAEEGKLRTDFSKKLEKHFLRCLFPGMTDELPEFYIKDVRHFDQDLPSVDREYIYTLKNEVPSLAAVLRVPKPDVYARLLVPDPTMQSTMAGMRREDSFFTNEQFHPMQNLSRAFPSGTWDEFDLSSPRDIPTFQARSPSMAYLNQSMSLHFKPAPSLQNLEECQHDALPSGTPSSSMPIQIPGMHMPQHLIRQMSKASSQFSTPDDHFDAKGQQEQFAMDGCTQRSITLEQLKPIAAELMKMKEELDMIKSEMLAAREKFEKDLSPLSANGEIFLSIRSERTAHEIKVKQLAEQLEDLVKEKEELNGKTSSLELELSESKERCFELEEDLKKKTEKLTELQEYKSGHEEQLKAVQNEVYKDLTIRYELAKDDLQREHSRQIDEREEKIRNLHKELERKNSEIERLKSDPDTDGYRTQIKNDIRQELEKEYKHRTDIITKTLQQKSEENMARHKKEIEYDAKKTMLDLQHQLKWITEERNRLKTAMEATEDQKAAVEKITQEIEIAASKDASELHVSSSYGAFSRISVLTQTDTPIHTPVNPLSPLMLHDLSSDMSTSLERRGSMPSLNSSNPMDQSIMPVNASQFYLDSSHPSHEDFGRIQSPDQVQFGEIATEDDSREMGTQTKLSMKTVETMVTIQDVTDGSTVLILWDDRHRAYVLFSSSPFIHFVKESSLRRMQLSLTNPKRTWILGRVIKVDLCVIKKPENRYKLPIEARVYRVEVEPVPIEPPPTSSSRSRASTSAN
ncbi:unnamed protein product, partial [Mesorhabditis spiculigera]